MTETVTERGRPIAGPASLLSESLADGRRAILALPDDLAEADAKRISAILTTYATS